jgi:Tol biopolymer transport system component
MKRIEGFALALLVSLGCATSGVESMTDADRAAQQAIAGKVKGQIVWSSARLGNHDLFVMSTDGSDVHPITKGETVDWFPRFSPDGHKILFTRSKEGWVNERDANDERKWDIWTITPEGKDETKVVENASWGGWINNDELIYVRGTKVFRRPLAGGEEKLLVDSQSGAGLDGALLQQPEMSRDGKYLAITLRGSKRETGIWDLAKKTWTSTGLGCQINWTPDGERIYWVNPTGNGGSEVFTMALHDGKPAKAAASDDELKLMDLPGRRSHEYFPELSADGKWMVWGVTQRGHDHDTADYEIYIWQVGSPAETAARLTFDGANDRWPDIFIPGVAPVAAAAPEKAAASPVAAKPEEKAAVKKPAASAKKAASARKPRRR